MPSMISRKNLSKSDAHSPLRLWFGRFLMALGVVMLISISVSFASLYMFFTGVQTSRPLPDQYVLFHHFKGNVPDFNVYNNSILGQFMPQIDSVYDIIRSLEVARDDDAVTALAVKIDDGDYGLEQIQVLRNAVLNFRQSGKKALIYADNYGGFSNGLGEYWLASAFDEIWVQPIGIVSLNGIRIEQPFFKDALNMIGADMEISQRKSYKTGAEMYMRDDMSSQNRETLQAIIDDIMTVIGDDIKLARGFDAVKFKSIIDNSPLIVEEAKNLNLVDKVGYFDEFEESARNSKDALVEHDKYLPFVTIGEYKSTTYNKAKMKSGISKVAIVMVEGVIMDINAESSGSKAIMFPENIADAQNITKSIDAMAINPNIEVIILRVNSPGGSPSASETIRRAVVNARNEGKYVIISMGEVAASGGYWVSVDADDIVAAPLTITGSIGVYGGKPDLSGLWDKIGVNWGVVEYGQNAAMWSSNVGYNASERKRLEILMDRVYEAFISRVADGRDMKPDDVEKIAQGRAWTGLDAFKNGLVDIQGGFDTALSHAAQKAGYEHWITMPIVVLPMDDDPFGDIAKLLGLPSVFEMPKLPQIFMPAIFDDAIVTAPTMKIDF